MENQKNNSSLKAVIAVLAILTGFFIGMLFLRNDVEATILHMPGQLFQHEGDTISNVYNYKIINKTEGDFNKVTFKLVNSKGEIKLVGKPFISIPRQGFTQGTMFVKILEKDLNKEDIELQIEVFNNNRLIETAKTNFNGPRNFN